MTHKDEASYHHPPRKAELHPKILRPFQTALTLHRENATLQEDDQQKDIEPDVKEEEKYHVDVLKHNCNRTK